MPQPQWMVSMFGTDYVQITADKITRLTLSPTEQAIDVGFDNGKVLRIIVDSKRTDIVGFFVS